MFQNEEKFEHRLFFKIRFIQCFLIQDLLLCVNLKFQRETEAS